jgi:hypothetical protein
MCAWQEFKYRMLLLRAADCGKNSPPSTNQLLQKTSLRISGLRFVSRDLCFTLVSTLPIGIVVNGYMAFNVASALKAPINVYHTLFFIIPALKS